MSFLFDILLYPFGSLSPLWGLMWICALTGVLIILIFKKASDQNVISGIRRRMGARALGMLLYLESPLTVMKLALALIADNFVYLWHLLRPMLVIAVPFYLVATQLDARYGFLPPSEERPSTVIMRWEDDLPASAPGAIVGSIVSPVVTVADSLETSFSFTGFEGEFSMSDPDLVLGRTGGRGTVVTRGAGSSGIVRWFLKPWNAAAPEGLESARVFLQPAEYNILGGRWGWFTVFLVFSSLWAIAGAVIFKVKV